MSIGDLGPRQMLESIARLQSVEVQQYPELVRIIKGIGEHAEELTDPQKKQIRKDLSHIKHVLAGTSQEKSQVVREMQKVEALLFGGGLKRLREEVETEAPSKRARTENKDPLVEKLTELAQIETPTSDHIPLIIELMIDQMHLQKANDGTTLEQFNQLVNELVGQKFDQFADWALEHVAEHPDVLFTYDEKDALIINVAMIRIAKQLGLASSLEDNPEKKEAFSRVLLDMPEEKIVQFLALLSHKDSAGDETTPRNETSKFVSQFLVDMTVEQTFDTMHGMLSLLEGVEDDREMDMLLWHLSWVPKETRADVLREVKPLLDACANTWYRIRVLDLNRDCPIETLRGYVHLTLPFFEGIKDERSMFLFIHSLRNFPPEIRADVLRVALPLRDYLADLNDRAMVLESARDFTIEKLSGFVNVITPLFKGIEDENEKHEILGLLLDIIESLPEDEAARMLVDITPSFSQRTTHEARIALLSHLLPDAAYYQISVHRNDLEDTPFEVLNLLCELFRKYMRRRLDIELIGERGIDAGGLGREFIGSLLKNLIKKAILAGLFVEGKNKLCRPEVHRELTDDDYEFYRQLGMLLMFLFNSTLPYPTGMLVDQSMFVAMSKFRDHHINQGFDSIDCKELIPIVIDMFRHDETQKDFVRSLEVFDACLPVREETLEAAFGLVEYEEGMEDLAGATIDQLWANAPRIEAALRGLVMSKTKPMVLPIFQIALGMRSSPFDRKISWEAIQKTHPARLSIALQGTVTKEDVLKKLSFERIPPPIQEWVRDWINDAPDEKLKYFVYMLSGTPALGEKAKIIIKQSPVSCAFHTCSLEVDLNPEWHEIKNEGKLGLYKLLDRTMRLILESGGIYGLE